MCEETGTVALEDTGGVYKWEDTISEAEETAWGRDDGVAEEY
jgi:hypothetical protein